MNEKRAYLLGFHLGDGCLTAGPRGSTVVKYECIDEDIIELCSSILFSEFGSDVTVRENPKKHVFICVSQKLSVCEWVESLVGFAGYSKRWPKLIEGCSKELKIAFLAGLMDSDGFISIKYGQKYWHKKNQRYYTQRFMSLIGFCNTAPWIVNVVNLVQSLGVKTGGIKETIRRKSGYKGTMPMKKVYFNEKSYIDSGCFFVGERKQSKLRTIAFEKQLSEPSESIRQTLKQFKWFNEDVLRSA